MAEENKHPPTTEEQAPPEMSGKAPEMEQAEIPDVGGAPAPSAKVIDLSAVRSAPEKDAPPDIPKEPEAPPVSVTEYSKQEWEKPKAAQERPRERKLKFSFKEQREFETIDEDLAALEQQIRECEEAQGACGSDYVKLQELQAKQAELEAALEEKTERWMYLTELKEKIDAQ